MLHLFQELNKGEVGSSSEIETLTNPNLFLELKARNTNFAQVMSFSGPVRGWDVRIKPRFSFASKKKGLLADSSAIATLAVGADEEECALDESEAMSNQENEENKKIRRKFLFGKRENEGK